MGLLDWLAPPRDDEEELGNGPLSETELKGLRRLLLAEKRESWMRGIIRRTLLWLAGIITGLLTFSDKLLDLWAKVVKVKGGG